MAGRNDSEMRHDQVTTRQGIVLQPSMLSPEIVELVIDRVWGCLSTSSYQHGLSMTRWMLVSRWLKIVLSIVFRDLWITSDDAHLQYFLRICNSNISFICGLAGITDIHQHLTRTCVCVTISVYHKFQGDYTDQCRQLIEYATNDSHRAQLFSGLSIYVYKHHTYAISSRGIAIFLSNYTPAITTLHFVLIDCTATYRAWDTTTPPLIPLPLGMLNVPYPGSLTELHVTFAYTTPPHVLLMDAPRGTFFPPPSTFDLPLSCRFDGVQRLVVRDANADFVAFVITACPQLKEVESTAEFSREDVPENVLAAVRDRLTFVRLPRTVNWGLTGSTDALPSTSQATPVGKIKRRWRLLERVKYVFRKR
ncbi:hypothetical protein C8R45DRAFT_1077179 [Mycena sanguinolenta]|nr:hypothetical protein C8R45DRAFT_1077179 [Mycena sanguinolenta]